MVAKKTQAKQAYDTIRERIVSGEFRPGESLNEQVLIQLTGLGHTPVRDALQWLSHEGLVDITPRRGTFVSQLNLEDVQQIFEVRIAMESVVADAVIARVRDADLLAVDTLIEKVDRDDTPVSDPAVDREFHDLLLSIAGNRYLTKFYASLHDASLRLFSVTRCEMESRDSQRTTLVATRDALARRDRDDLQRIMTDHVRDFRRRVGGALTR